VLHFLIELGEYNLDTGEIKKVELSKIISKEGYFQFAIQEKSQ